MAKSASQQRREKMQRKREREAASEKKTKNKNRISMIFACILGAGIVIAIIVALAIWLIPNEQQRALRKTVVTSKYYNLTLADMQYLFYENYNRFMEENAENVKIDETIQLRQQIYNEETGQTWFDYFCEAAKENAEHYIMMASAARDNGYTLSKDDKKEIDGLIDAFEEYGGKEGYSLPDYIEYAYGKGISEKNIRKCQELITLANKYYNDKVDEATMKFKDEDYVSFLENNFDEYAGSTCFVEYMYFSFEPDYKEGDSEEDKEKAKEAAIALADELAQNTDVKKFKEVLVKYIELTQVAEDKDMTAEEYVDYRYTTKSNYSVATEFGKWAFADEREVGHTRTEEKNGEYVVYCLTKTNHFDETPTKNIRHILIEPSQYSSKEEARVKAESLLKEWKEGEATEDSFGEIARLNSTDKNSFENGGLYMYLRKGEMGQAAFDDWCFSAARSEGDTGIVETTYGYHVMYFVEDAIPTWQATLIGGMQEEAYEELCEQLVKEYPSTVKIEYFKYIID